MRIALLGMALVGLAGCESAGEKAERSYNEVAGKGDFNVSCRAAREASDAYIREGNGDKAREMNRKAEGECAGASLTGQ